MLPSVPATVRTSFHVQGRHGPVPKTMSFSNTVQFLFSVTESIMLQSTGPWRRAQEEARAFQADPNEYRRKHTQPAVNPFQFQFPLQHANVSRAFRFFPKYLQIAERVQLPRKTLSRCRVLHRSIKGYLAGKHMKSIRFESIAAIKSFIGRIVSIFFGTNEYNHSQYLKEWYILAGLLHSTELATAWHPEQLCWSMIYHHPFWRGKQPPHLRAHLLRTRILPHLLAREAAENMKSEQGPDMRNTFATELVSYGAITCATNLDPKHSSTRALAVRKRISKSKATRQTRIVDFFSKIQSNSA